MFKKEDILARLRAGESAETIADEMTKALNDASAELKAEKADEDKLAMGRRFLGVMNEYLATYHPDAAVTKDALAEPLTDKSVRSFLEAADQIVEGYEKMATLVNVTGNLFGWGEPVAKSESIQDPLAKFLSDHKL